MASKVSATQHWSAICNMSKFVLLLIVTVYFLVGTLYAVKTPDWQVPDEPAHYNYIRQLAQEGRFPILEIGDYDQDYLGRLTSERFPAQLSVADVEYEDHQPPLYYLLGTPVYRTFDGALTPLRLFSVLIGAGVVLLAYAVADVIFPTRPLIPLGTAAFVAFLPQHVAMMAGVNNDSLIELLIGVTLWMVVRWVREAWSSTSRDPRSDVGLIALGVVIGLGLVTKATILPVALAVAFAVWLVWWRSADRTRGQLIRALALVFGPALLVVAPWWWRNGALYGGFDIYGLVNHDAVVFGQPRTVDWIRDEGIGSWLERGITFTFQSFWGQFGWMGVLMPTWLYRALALAVGGLAVGLFNWLRVKSLEAPNGAGNSKSSTHSAPSLRTEARNTQLLFLATTAVFVVLAYLYYNRTFVQHQGRYLFPALIPIAIGVALGVDGLLRLIRWPDRLHWLAFALPFLGLIALDLYALWRLILPALA